MKSWLFAFWILPVTGGIAHGAIIQLQNSIDGSNSVTISPKATADINIVIITAAADLIPVAGISTLLDSDNGLAVVADVSEGQNWTYDRSNFVLPASINEQTGNDYWLISLDEDGGDSLPLGSATHVIDTLTLATEAESGSTQLWFDVDSHPPSPQLVGPGPTYVPFVVAPLGFPPGFPNFLYVGDSSSTNPAFEINYVPEPVMLLPLVLLSTMVIDRGRRMTFSNREGI